MENHQHLVAGWMGGIFGIAVGHPMDTIKTHQQISNDKLSTREAIKRIFNKSGFHGFFRGMLFPLIGAGGLNSLYFGTIDAYLGQLDLQKDHISVYPQNNDWMQNLFIAGSIGGAAQTLITCPSELIKIRMQLGKGVIKDKVYTNQPAKKLRTSHVILDVYTKYGLHGFFVGFMPTLLRDAVGGGAYILSYQCTRHYMSGKLNLSPAGFFETVVAGGVAGFASWLPVIPFDTIKCRMQSDTFQNPKYKGMLHCSWDLFHRTGYHGFFKGLPIILVRSVPVNCAIMCGYELTLWCFRNNDKS
ncbi:hypothetical protein QAD02_004445 [Eretmocerus hayati]|uniref:Uncharacterized protein n=1 Tax=Eretmocerus hayati TaxID=131215 RepID=A0ACC2NQN5_9HYME|nr:hypothetical protein QAD02_004445 [Eretmocerus hayati]